MGSLRGNQDTRADETAKAFVGTLIIGKLRKLTLQDGLMKLGWIGLFLVPSSVGSVNLAVEQSRHLTPHDLPKIVRVSDPQMSSDGKTVAFCGGANLKDNRWAMGGRAGADNDARQDGDGDAALVTERGSLTFLALDANKKSEI